MHSLIPYKSQQPRYALKQQSQKLREQMAQVEAMSRKLAWAVQTVVTLQRGQSVEFEDSKPIEQRGTWNV